MNVEYSKPLTPFQHDPRLDGVRAIAIILVMLVHSRAPYSGFGRLGVDIFFVLSGYLITRGLIVFPDLRRFFALRAGRLFPALLLLVTAYLMVTEDIVGVIPVVLYLSDITGALMREPHMLLHTWSLSVEEHYYMAWPFVLPWLIRQRNSLKLMLWLWVLLCLWRACSHEIFGFSSTYYRTDTRISGLILGSALAMGLRISSKWIWLALPAFLIALSRGFWSLSVAIPLIELATAALITSPPVGLAKLAPLGVISYGVYLWHYFIFSMMKGDAWYDRLLWGGALTILIACLSYYLIEAPLRRWVRARVEGWGAEPVQISATIQHHGSGGR